ncbi:hypothetical protein HMI54_011971 [Coelomomyces lativittatus]|nr:hypothetical protein HMI56_004563 [Coelomomyces lativittatus]KAJ1499236.1 hypothetical protein HMI54_011971 [Coelomomyces lativittatus]
MRLPEAFRRIIPSMSELPVYTQLILYGAIPNTLCDPLLERLAAIFPESFSSTFMETEMMKQQDPLERIKGETGFLYAEYVWIPEIETPPGPERNDDVILRLSSPLASSTLNDPQNTWSLQQFGRPETGSTHWHTLRRWVRTMPVNHFGPCLPFLKQLGYLPFYQFAKKGYAFHYQHTVLILVYKIYNLPPPDTLRVNLNGVPSIKPNQDIWMVELLGQPPTYHLQARVLEYLENVERDMMTVVGFLKGWVDLQRVDPLLMRGHIPYSVK